MGKKPRACVNIVFYIIIAVGSTWFGRDENVTVKLETPIILAGEFMHGQRTRFSQSIFVPLQHRKI